MECDDASEALTRIAEHLMSAQLVNYLEPVFGAKVPIIKFDLVDSGISFDVCVNNDTGLDTGSFVKAHLSIFPQLKPLAITLKMYLVCNCLQLSYSPLRFPCRANASFMKHTVEELVRSCCVAC